MVGRRSKRKDPDFIYEENKKEKLAEKNSGKKKNSNKTKKKRRKLIKRDSGNNGIEDCGNNVAKGSIVSSKEENVDVKCSGNVGIKDCTAGVKCSGNVGIKDCTAGVKDCAAGGNVGKDYCLGTIFAKDSGCAGSNSANPIVIENVVKVDNSKEIVSNKFSVKVENAMDNDSDKDLFENLKETKNDADNETPKQDSKKIIKKLKKNSLMESIIDKIDDAGNVILKEIPSLAYPKKSKLFYERRLKAYINWMKEHVACETEDTYIAYFSYLIDEKKYKSSTIWNVYAILNFRLKFKNSTLKNFQRLQVMLKNYSKGFLYKKADTFTQEDVKEILSVKTDSPNFLNSVLFAVGYFGSQLLLINFENVTSNDSEILFKVPKIKTSVEEKTFVISNEKGIKLNNSYINLVPSKIRKGRFFKVIRSGTPINSPIGINSIHKSTKCLAKMLNKENSERFTSHSMRRSGASHLAENNISQSNFFFNFII